MCSLTFQWKKTHKATSKCSEENKTLQGNREFKLVREGVDGYFNKVEGFSNETCMMEEVKETDKSVSR